MRRIKFLALNVLGIKNKIKKAACYGYLVYIYHASANYDHLKVLAIQFISKFKSLSTFRKLATFSYKCENFSDFFADLQRRVSMLLFSRSLNFIY